MCHTSLLPILSTWFTQLLKTDSVTGKPEKPAPVPPNAPPAFSSLSVPAPSPAKTAGHPLPAAPPPLTETEIGPKEQKPPLVEGTGAKEEYGYIVTNQR